MTTSPKRKLSNSDIHSPTTKRFNNRPSSALGTDSLEATLDQYIESIRNAIDHEQYDAAIEESNKGVKSMPEHVAIDLVQLRAAAWAKKLEFDQAIKDALLIMEWVPHQATGYLLASELYSSLGYHEQAVCILKRGMNAVQDHVQQEEYKVLEERKSIAEAQLERRVDFISDIPYDILWKFANYLSGNSRSLYECIHVCQSWRNKILGCSGFWKKVTLKGQDVAYILHMMSYVTNEIQELQLNTYQASVEKVFDMMQRKKFGTLRSLSVTVSAEEPRQRNFTKPSKRRIYDPIIIYGQISNILPEVAQTLTTLQLKLYNVSDAPALIYILSTCRNLRYIDYACPLLNAFTGLTSLEHTTSLTSISLSSSISPLSSRRSDIYLTSSNLEALLRSSPHVRWLYLDQIFFDVLSIIQRLDLHLEFIALNSYSGKAQFLSLMQHGWAADKQERANNNDSSGVEHRVGRLHYLSVDGWSPPDVLRTFLEKNCDSLEKMHLSRKCILRGSIRGQHRNRQQQQDDDRNDPIAPSHNRNLSEIIKPITKSIRFPVLSQLTELNINGIYPTPKGFWPGLSKIICNCPNLNALDISDGGVYNIAIDDEDNDSRTNDDDIATINSAVNSIAQFGTISTMKLSIINHPQFYSQLLQSYAALDPDICPLQELNVHFNLYRPEEVEEDTVDGNNEQYNKETMEIIIATATIKSLRKLHWYNHRENIRESEMLKFTHAIGELPFLDHLSIKRGSVGRRFAYFPDQIIYNICKSKSIKSLYFAGEFIGYDIEKARQMFHDHRPHPIEFKTAVLTYPF